MARTRGLTLQAADRPWRSGRGHRLCPTTRCSAPADCWAWRPGRRWPPSRPPWAPARNRYLAEGLEGLTDRPAAVGPPTYTDADWKAMWKRLQADPRRPHPLEPEP